MQHDHNCHSLNLSFQRTDERRAPKDRNIAETDPPKFAQMLIERLELELEEQKNKEKFHVTLSKVDQVGIYQGYLVVAGTE